MNPARLQENSDKCKNKVKLTAHLEIINMLVFFIYFYSVTKSLLNALQAGSTMHFIMDYILQISLTNKQM